MMTMLSMPGMIELLFLLLLFFPVLILFIAALVDILKGKFRDNDKLVWIVVVVLLPLLGPILYFIIGSKQKIRGE